MQEQKQPSEMNELELKAAIYDQLVGLETLKNNLELLKQELGKRIQK